MNNKSEHHVTIPYPRATQNVNRGYLTSTPKMEVRCIRITQSDRAFIEKTSRKLNMSFSEFVRWVSYYTALQVSNDLALEGFADKADVISKSLADQGFK